MDYWEYKNIQREIRTRCHTRFGLICALSAGLVLGAKGILGKLDVDIGKYQWIQYPADVVIGGAALYYTLKEKERLEKLEEAYEKANKNEWYSKVYRQKTGNF